jgi:DNA-binding CsgD family transcriptional regulator
MTSAKKDEIRRSYSSHMSNTDGFTNAQKARMDRGAIALLASATGHSDGYLRGILREERQALGVFHSKTEGREKQDLALDAAERGDSLEQIAEALGYDSPGKALESIGYAIARRFIRPLFHEEIARPGWMSGKEAVALILERTGYCVSPGRLRLMAPYVALRMGFGPPSTGETAPSRIAFYFRRQDIERRGKEAAPAYRAEHRLAGSTQCILDAIESRNYPEAPPDALVDDPRPHTDSEVVDKAGWPPEDDRQMKLDHIERAQADERLALAEAIDAVGVEEDEPNKPQGYTLTPREQAAWDLREAGLSASAAAQKLGVTNYAIRNRWGNAMRKMRDAGVSPPLREAGSPLHTNEGVAKPGPTKAEGFEPYLLGRLERLEKDFVAVTKEMGKRIDSLNGSLRAAHAKIDDVKKTTAATGPEEKNNRGRGWFARQWYGE